MTDGQLVQAFVGGDQKAFAELVHRHANWVWGCALRQVGENSLAEDITQGTFILLARKAAGLPAGIVLDGWLFRVVHYLAKDARKTSARRQFHEARVAAMKRDEAEGTQDWDAIHSILDNAVAKLREQDRRAVLLRFYQQMSLGEVAKAMQISEASAAKRVSRAVDRLREALAGEGYRSAQEVQEVLETGMACTAPAALVAQIAAGSNSATGTLLAAKAAKMLVAAKLKAVAVVTGVALVAGGAVGGAITAAHRPAPGATASATTAPAQVREAIVQAPPIREDRKTVAVCLAIVTLPQSAIGDVLTNTQQIKLDPKLEIRLGESVKLRPILRNLVSQYADTNWLLLWNRFDWGRFDNELQQTRYLAPPPARGLRPAAWVKAEGRVDASDPAQVAGGYSIQYQMGDPGPLPTTSIAFTPQTLRPGQMLVHIVRGQQDPRIDRALMMIYEAVVTDASDFKAIATIGQVASWYARPISDQLRIARAGAVWEAQAPPNPAEFEKSRWGRILPSGAKVWICDINDASVHPIASWLPDGRPGRLSEGTNAPLASVRIQDPNIPSRFGPDNVFTDWFSVPLKRQANGGYAFRIAYGDGPYKPVGRIPLKDGASFAVGGCTMRLTSVQPASSGYYTFNKAPDCGVALFAIGKDGKRYQNHNSYQMWRIDDAPGGLEQGCGFDIKRDDIDAIEVCTRPFVVLDFDGIATHPAVPLPTGLEPPPPDRATQLDAAAPRDRKAFLDQTQCMRFWMDSPQMKWDTWTWRDGRYRTEAWIGNEHTLRAGDDRAYAEYNFATGKWDVSPSGKPDQADFAQLVRRIGSIEHTLKIGEKIGQEKVDGVDCAIHTAKQESAESKVWLDSLGLIHRLAFTGPQGGASTVTYDPPNAARVWVAPVLPEQKPFEQIAEEYLAKVIPAGKPVFEANAVGRQMQLLSIARIKDDVVLLCTSTQLTPEARKHRDQTNEKWLATQLTSCGPSDIAWTPRVAARVHTPYREITWWVAQTPKGNPDPDLLELLVWLGRPSPAEETWTMEPWLAKQPGSQRMHLLQLDLASVEHDDLESSLKRIYAVIEGYRALGKAAQRDLVTASDSWDLFRSMAGGAINGGFTIFESGR